MLQQPYKVAIWGSLTAIIIVGGSWLALQNPEMPEQLRAASTDASSDVLWSNDPEAALARAAADERPLVIMFYAQWCGICEHMKQTTLADEQVKQKLGDVVPLMVDVEVHRSFVNRFDVLGLPTTVIATSQGEAIHTRPGYMDRDAYLALLDHAVD